MNTPTTETSANDVLLGFATLLQISAVATNAPILVVIWSRRLLRSASTRFVFSLCAAHLLLNLFLVGWAWFFDHAPSSPVPILAGLVVQLASLGLLTLISLDRYIAIARPMECRNILTPKRALLGILIVWGVALFVVVVPGLALLPYEEDRWVWGVYFGLLLGAATIAAITLMTLAYSYIFAIAREKCRTVRLGEFRQERGSISSEWGTSVGGGGGVMLSPSSKPLPRGSSSQSLLHRLLQQRQSASPPTSIRSAPCSPTMQHNDAGLRRAKRRWRAYLRHNYNSPKKTVATILSLIGSVVLCSLPPAVALLISPSLFAPIQALLLPLSSNLHPLLYGILNRAIRHHLVHGKRASLPKSLRRRLKNKEKPRKISTLGELRSVYVPPSRRVRPTPYIHPGSRRGSTTSEEERETPLLQPMARPRLETGYIGQWGNNNRTPVVVVVEDDGDEEEEEEEEVAAPPRKSSTDSGADMHFSEGEEDVDNELESNRLTALCNYLSTSKSESDLCSYLVRSRDKNHIMPADFTTKLSISADGDLNRGVGRISIAPLLKG